MKILMFGWEFPPHVSGGLGTACYGMTKALTGLGQDILFVVPGTETGDAGSPVRLVATDGITQPEATALPTGLVIRPVASPLRPYMNDAQYHAYASEGRDFPPESYLAVAGGYDGDLMTEVLRYGRAAAVIAQQEPFDIIHAHDWMTVPAALTAKEQIGKPFVFHVHSLEFDRSGESVNPSIYDMERSGLECADVVIAVSHYTRDMIVDRYGINRGKIVVVHNAVSRNEGRSVCREKKDGSGKVVLFLGRITFQKGPDYFVEAAAKVAREMPEVTFVMAGAGELMPRMIERVAELGLGSRFHFTGFLRDKEVEQMFAQSDLYVMPSVSEPFGIAPLEAMMLDVPVIISKQSGVAEILHHALKVDFWDVDDLADKMIAVLKYPPLTGELVTKGRDALRNIQWENAAAKILAVYEQCAIGAGKA